MKSYVLLAASALLVCGCVSSVRVERADGVGSSSGGADSKRLVGTWRLVSFESRSAGEIRYPMGRAAAGQLNYDEMGNVSAHIMDPSRPAFASGDRAAGTDDEVRKAFVGYLAYYGTYDLDETKRTVTHHITGASFPNWIGVDQVRLYRLDGDRLTITTPPIRAGGEDLITVLVWERTR